MMMHRLVTILAVAAATSAPAAPAAKSSSVALRDAVTLHASFDRGGDADFARGDRQVYTAAERNKRDAAQPGLHADDQVRIAPGEGKFGGALEFRKKIKQQVF